MHSKCTCLVLFLCFRPLKTLYCTVLHSHTLTPCHSAPTHQSGIIGELSILPKDQWTCELVELEADDLHSLRTLSHSWKIQMCLSFRQGAGKEESESSECKALQSGWPRADNQSAKLKPSELQTELSDVESKENENKEEVSGTRKRCVFSAARFVITSAVFRG